MDIFDFSEAEERPTDEFEDLVGELDLLMTGHRAFDALNQATLDWIEGEGDAAAVRACFERLDLTLADSSCFTLQRQMEQLLAAVETGAAESVCLGLLCVGRGLLADVHGEVEGGVAARG